AIAALEAAISLSRTRAADLQTRDDEEGNGSVETPVPFHVRAHPFLKMLRQSHATQENVTWGI
nr:DUF1840 family protein [Brachymonas sp.]